MVTIHGPDSLTRTNSAISLLSKLGVDRKRIGVVIVDRTGIGISGELSTSTSIGDSPIVGIIPFDAKECADAEERGIPLTLSAPLSPAAMALRTLTERLLSLEQLAPINKKGNNGG